MKLLNLAAAGVGAGLGAMYLGNEGEGETFTSYPNPSRIKQMLGSKVNEPESFPGSGQNIYGQKYGKALSQEIAMNQMDMMMRDQNNHKIIWETFTNRPAKGKFYENFVRENNMEEKRKKLLRFAVDADDALYMSREYLAIAAARGDDYLLKRHGANAHSALELDYSKSGAVDHGEVKAAQR